MLFLSLIVMLFSGIKRIFNIYSGTETVNSSNVYLDNNNHYRYITNNEKVVETYNTSGDKIVKSLKNRNVLLNCDVQESQKRKQIALENNLRFYLFWVDKKQGYTHDSNPYIKGDRYKEVIDCNDNIYVIRHIVYAWTDINPPLNIWNYQGNFYMDMNFNFYLPTEEQVIKDKETYNNRYDEIEKYILNLLNTKIQSILNFQNNALLYLPTSDSSFYIGNANNYYFVNQTLNRRR